jgi:hypothetical protein
MGLTDTARATQLILVGAISLTSVGAIALTNVSAIFLTLVGAIANAVSVQAYLRRSEAISLTSALTAHRF